MFSNIFVAEK
jgi:hypothetical protein